MSGLLNLFKGWNGDPEIEEEPVQVETANRREEERWEAIGEVILQWVKEDGSREAIEASLLDRSPDGLRVVSPREFSVGDELFVVLPKGKEEKAAVRHHKESEAGWQLGLRVIHNERRRFQRFRVDGKAVLHWTADSTGQEKTEVEVKNVAQGGLQLRASEQVPTGTTVKITGDVMECVGVTWYCRPEGDGFLIGVQMSRDPYDRGGLDFHEF